MFLDLKIYPDEIIVDATCGAAVLRGSHVYAPGVIGMPNGKIFVHGILVSDNIRSLRDSLYLEAIKFVKLIVGLIVNTKVSVFADVTGQCKKGLIKPYPNSNKLYLGNGIVRQTRKELFCKAAGNPWYGTPFNAYKTGKGAGLLNYTRHNLNTEILI